MSTLEARARYVVGALVGLGITQVGCRRAPSVEPSAAATTSLDVVRARQFVLVDSEGRQRAVLGLGEGSDPPALRFYAADGRLLAELTGDEKSPTLTLRNQKYQLEAKLGATGFRVLNSDGLPLARIGVDAAGTTTAGVMTLQSKGGTPLVTLTSVADGPPTLILVGDDGRGNVLLTIEDGRPRFELMDKDGQPVSSQR